MVLNEKGIVLAIYTSLDFLPTLDVVAININGLLLKAMTKMFTETIYNLYLFDGMRLAR